MINYLTNLITDYTFQVVALGCVLLGIISGALGSLAVLRKQSLLGDGISHSALPGVVIAFLLTGDKSTEILLLGAAFTGILSAFIISGIVKNTRIKFDSALALILSVFFGFGIVLLTYSQKVPNSNQAGLDRFIYGQASSLVLRDLVLMLVCGVVLFALLLVFWKEIKVFLFDHEYTGTLGYNVHTLGNLISVMVVIAILIGLQTVGAILMSSMLITPAVAARQWTNKLSVLIILSAIFGAVSGFFGTVISSAMPKTPTGPVIVICVSVVAIFSLLVAPNRGIIYKIYRRKKHRAFIEKIKEEKNYVS